MENNNVGKRIAALRKKNGWSQMELAEKINVTDKAVSKWENGGMPGIDIFPKLSKIFNVSIDYLMLGEDGGVLTEEETDEIGGAADSEEESFEESLKSMSRNDLVLILRDQSELYTDEELELIKARYNELRVAIDDQDEQEEKLSKEERKRIAIANLPKNLKCPKCDGINEQPDQFCAFCNYNFLNARIEYSTDTEIAEEHDNDAGTLAYIVALLFPLIGLIWGIVEKDKSLITFSLIVWVVGTLLGIGAFFLYPFVLALLV